MTGSLTVARNQWYDRPGMNRWYGFFSFFFTPHRQVPVRFALPA
jgi:hypothetical protein